MHNFYKMLHLDSADAPIGEIQKQCKAIAQSGELPLEHVKKIYAVLSDNEKRAKYNVTLRQAEPDFFQQPKPLEPTPSAIPTQNFYRLLNLTSANVDERTIQKHLQKAVSSGEISLEIGQQIRDTLLNIGKRSVYNQTLRQSDPDFFRPPARMSIDDEDSKAYDAQESKRIQAESAESEEETQSAGKGKFILDNQVRNILFSLFLLGAVAVFLPWMNAMGVSFAGYKVTWLNPILFAWCAFKVWTAHAKEGELDYLSLLVPLVIVSSNHIRFVMSINKKLNEEFLIESHFSYGIGFYLQVMVIVAICAYLFICYMKNKER